MRNGQQGDDHDDADHAQTADNGESRESGEEGFKSADGQTLCACKIAIVGEGDDAALKEEEEKQGDGGEDSHGEEIAVRNAEDVAKEIGGEVGHKTGGKIGKENADAHAECPYHGDGTVAAHFAFATQPVDAKTTG